MLFEGADLEGETLEGHLPAIDPGEEVGAHQLVVRFVAQSVKIFAAEKFESKMS